MDARVRREALKAAAKVAMSVAAIGAIGCGGSTTTSTETQGELIKAPPREEPNTPPATSGTATTPANPPVAEAGTTNPATDAGGPIDLQACQASFDSERSEPSNYPGDPLASTPENVACCNAMLTKHDDDWQFEVKHRWDCCATLEAANQQYQGTACTPWGPPMPPMMAA